LFVSLLLVTTSPFILFVPKYLNKSLILFRLLLYASTIATHSTDFKILL
jgi:hypothetical protein